MTFCLNRPKVEEVAPFPQRRILLRRIIDIDDPVLQELLVRLGSLQLLGSNGPHGL